MQNNAYFKLSIRYDGLYIVLHPPSSVGQALAYDELQRYLKKQQIKSSDMTELTAALSSQTVEMEIKLTESESPQIGESLFVAASKDKMTATVRFYAGTEQGARLTKEDIFEQLNKSGIIYGINEEMIDNWLEDRVYCTDILIAEGTPPEKSRDAVIEYMFDTEKRFKATVDVDGTVNFHQLNIINNVVSGDVLAVLTPAYRGEQGTNVAGVALPSKKPLNKALKYGKNVRISDDLCFLSAMVSGFVDIDSGRVFVENVYSIKGDVGAATGDVVFDGIVRISGDILTGYSVKATSDVIIAGVIESSHVTSGGNIVIANGVYGGAKAFISAVGDITAKFIQEAVVYAEGNIFAGSILYSNVSSRSCIEVKSGKGLVKGGELRARTQLTLKTVGTMRTGSSSLLEVGANPDEIERFTALEEELAKKRAEQTKVRQGIGFLQKKINHGTPLTRDQDNLMKALPHRLELINAEIGKIYRKYIALKAHLTKSDSGKIVIEDIIYDGAKIVISGVSYYVREDLVQCQFVKQGMEIKVVGLDD